MRNFMSFFFKTPEQMLQEQYNASRRDLLMAKMRAEESQYCLMLLEKRVQRLRQEIEQTKDSQPA